MSTTATPRALGVAVVDITCYHARRRVNIAKGGDEDQQTLSTEFIFAARVRHHQYSEQLKKDSSTFIRHYLLVLVTSMRIFIAPNETT